MSESKTDFKYCRLQGKVFAANTKAPRGIFSILRKLSVDGVMANEDEELFKEIDSWIAEILPWPPQCQNKENVICYFKTENSQAMMKMIKPLLWLLERYKQPYFMVYTNYPGEIVYEDEYQVVVKAGESLAFEDFDWPNTK